MLPHGFITVALSFAVAMLVGLLGADTARGSCGDWLAHAPHVSAEASRAGLASYPPPEHASPRPHQPAVPPCDGPQCRQTPAPSPAAPATVRIVVEDRALIASVCDPAIPSISQSHPVPTSERAPWSDFCYLVERPPR